MSVEADAEGSFLWGFLESGGAGEEVNDGRLMGGREGMRWGKVGCLLNSC